MMVSIRSLVVPTKNRCLLPRCLTRIRKRRDIVSSMPFQAVQNAKVRSLSGAFVAIDSIDFIFYLGPKPCAGQSRLSKVLSPCLTILRVGTPIGKGELRFGTLVDIMGKTSLCVLLCHSEIPRSNILCSQWRHWGCVTSRILTNAKNIHDEASDVDGFEDLNDEDQGRVSKAWEEGHVADEDIPESARKPAKDGDDDEEEDKPKKKKAAPRKKKADAEDGDEETKPKKKAAPRKKVGLLFVLTHLLTHLFRRR